MIEHSTEFAQAITGSSRKLYARAIFDLVSPDAVVGNIASNSVSPISRTQQVSQRGADETGEKIATLEHNRWKLDVAWQLAPEDPDDRIGQSGWESGVLCGDDCAFAPPYPWLEELISGVDILQAATLQFSRQDGNGIPSDFTVAFWSGDTLVEERETTGNRNVLVVFDGLNVLAPTRMRLTVTKWSMPRRRARVVRFLMGLYERWDIRVLRSVDIYTESTFSGLSLPYSSCALEVYNEDHRFDPYAPDSLFRSIEERQSIPVELGARLSDGSIEWLPGGTYYQQSGGWALKDLTVLWKLVDVIGMLVKRKFTVPEVLPTTLDGWVGAVMSSLGVNLAGRYQVDADIADTPLTAAADAVSGLTCGNILRFACMAAVAWPHQDYSTGYLRVSKLAAAQGSHITRGNMPENPQMEANDDVADITFALDDGEVTFPGTNTESDISLSVKNPFVHTTDDARKAVRACFLEYGGRWFSVFSRGDFSSETGDIQTIDTQFGSTISARLYKQQLKLERGVMRNVPSCFIQSPNDMAQYTNRVILTGAGTWVAPDGVLHIKATLISGGDGGQGGQGGDYERYDPYVEDYIGGEDGETKRAEISADGAAGPGGLVFIREIDINAGQSIAYSCGAGGAGGEGSGTYAGTGAMGQAGAPTTFGALTTESGVRYPAGLMDIQTGAVYAMPGPGSGDKDTGSYGSGGIAGKAGAAGYQVIVRVGEPGSGSVHYYAETIVEAEPGKAGGPGQDGCIIVEW